MNLDLFSFLFQIDGFYFSMALVVTLIIDTLLALRVRLKSGVGLLSKRLKWGLLSNLTLAFLPSAIEVLHPLLRPNRNGELLLDIMQGLLFVGLFVGDFGSIAANYRLLYSQQTNWLIKLAELFFSSEIQAKVRAVFGEGETGKKP